MPFQSGGSKPSREKLPELSKSTPIRAVNSAMFTYLTSFRETRRIKVDKSEPKTAKEVRDKIAWLDKFLDDQTDECWEKSKKLHKTAPSSFRDITAQKNLALFNLVTEIMIAQGVEDIEHISDVFLEGVDTYGKCKCPSYWERRKFKKPNTGRPPPNVDMWRKRSKSKIKPEGFSEEDLRLIPKLTMDETDKEHLLGYNRIDGPFPIDSELFDVATL